MIRNLLINQKNHEKIAIIENNKEIPYCILIKKALALQLILQKSPEEKAAIFLPNGGDYIAAFWGTIQAGKMVLPLNILMTVCEVTVLLKQAAVTTVITLKNYHFIFEEMMINTAFPLQMIYIDDVEEYNTTVCRKYVTTSNVDPEIPMLLLSTSGTIQNPKIVQLSEKNVEVSVLGYLEKIYFDETASKNARYILAAPFSSVYGIMILSACLLKSFPLIVVEPAFTLNTLYQKAEKHQATHYEGGTCTLLLMEQMAGRHIPYDISSLTYFGFGGSKVSGSTVTKVQKAYSGIILAQGYGMTESAPLIAKQPWDGPEKTESVGTAIQGMEIAIETKNGITHAPYSKGEIVVKGPNVMLGYYNNKSETNKVLRNGYLHTGDIGYLDEDGYLYICGRKKNIIIVRGFNVYPEEVEACIQNSLLVRDCYVYGQAGGIGDEILCADIVPMDPLVQAKDIIAYCSSRLADYKQPKRIFLCETIEKNLSGKTTRKRGDCL